MKKAIIIGATSGIGRELAKQLDTVSYSIGATGRRKELLDSLSTELSHPSFTAIMDVSDIEDTHKQLESIVQKMKQIDLIVISAGIGHINPELTWEQELETVDINVRAFTYLADYAMKLFAKQKSGHLVTFSSLGSIRGEAEAPAYNASKAYVSNYMEGLAKKCFKDKNGITITDIEPGLVDTAMAKGEGLFWVMPVEKVSQQIVKAIQKKKRKVVVTKRWIMIQMLLKYLPFGLYKYL